MQRFDNVESSISSWPEEVRPEACMNTWLERLWICPNGNSISAMNAVCP
jgi:hypothetical protein